MSLRTFIALSKVSCYGSSGCFRFTKWKESKRQSSSWPRPMLLCKRPSSRKPCLWDLRFFHGNLCQVLKKSFCALFRSVCSSKELSVARRARERRERNRRWLSELWYGWWRRRLHALLDWHHHRTTPCEHTENFSFSFRPADRYYISLRSGMHWARFLGFQHL